MAGRRRKTNKTQKSGDDESLFGVTGNGHARAGEGEAGPGASAVALHEVAQRRYLNYALSVITSRALPDVRDGLKPVQRRILYTMWREKLAHPAKHRKCAGIVGSTMRDFHPHGDQAIYDALVRMAQPWVMREKLIDGSGNFGSLDDDPPAAMRYTEARLAPVTAEMLDQIDRQTVHFHPNYDATASEPVVLPARLPNLLVNGSAGIAVGMATNIPPHNLEEVCRALIRLIDDPELSSAQLALTVKGPDFPTGGQIISTRDALRDIYKTGSGAVKLRTTWEQGPARRGGGVTLIVTSVPYGANKAQLVEQIGQIIESRKMPLLLDVKDVSTEDVRIELSLKRGAQPQKVMAYLFRHTGLQTSFNVNLTCLVPTENPEVGRPQRCELREVLSYFLHFRLDVVTRRLEHELDQLERRIHRLEGFAFAFDVLDQIIAMIRESEGKADAARRILERFGVDGQGEGARGEGGLDAEQVDAILELRLYRLARLEINLIREELDQRRERATEIRKLLDEEQARGRWGIVREEIEALSAAYGKGAANGAGDRRTRIQAPEDEPEFAPEDFIVAEDNHVLVTADGWVKRQKEINVRTTRLREGDAVLSVQPGSTRASIVFFSNFGLAYTARIIDLPATTGYGEPIQKFFKLKDGEKIIAALSLDPRHIGGIDEDQEHPDHAPPTHGLAVSSDGYALRLGLGGLVEPSKRTGRKIARPAKGAQIIFLQAVQGRETVVAASQQRRAILCSAEEVNYLSGPGKGVQLIKLGKGDRVVGVAAATDERDTLTMKTSMGGEQRINTGRYRVVARGGRGHEVIKRGKLVEVVLPPPTAPDPLGEAS